MRRGCRNVLHCCGHWSPPHSWYGIGFRITHLYCVRCLEEIPTEKVNETIGTVVALGRLSFSTDVLVEAVMSVLAALIRLVDMG